MELRQSCDYMSEIERLEKILKDYPNDCETRFKLGTLYFKNEELEKSAEQFKEIIKQKPGLANAYLCLAQIYEKQKNLESAYNSYEKYVGLSKDEEKIELAREKLEKIGNALCEKLKVKLASEQGDTRIETLKQIVRFSPKSSAFDELLELYESTGKFELAENMIEKRLAIDEDKEVRLELKKKLNTVKGNISWVKVQVSENSAKSYTLLGKYFVDYDKEKAEGYFKNALELDPEFVFIYPEMGMLYLRWDKLDNAKESFDKYLELEKDEKKKDLARRFIALIEKEKNAETAKELNDVGYEYSKLDANKAISVFEGLIKQYPDDKTGLYNLAMAYTKIGTIDKAIDTWEKYLSIYPDDREARVNLVKLEKATGDLYHFDTKENENKFWKKWQNFYGKFEVARKELSGKGILLYNVPVKRGGVAFDFRGDKGVGILLNAKELDNSNLSVTRQLEKGYYFAVTGIGSNCRVYLEKNGGLAKDKYDVKFEPYKKYTLKAVNDGNNVRFFIDEQEIISVPADSSVNGDKIMIYVAGDNSYLDNVKIK